MRINVRRVKQAIDKRYYGQVWLLEQTEGLSGVEKILSRGRCSVGMASTMCKILHIPFCEIV